VTQFWDPKLRQRARWIDHITAEIEYAQRLAWEIGCASDDNSEANRLYGELETIRSEVDAIRLSSYAEVQAGAGLDLLCEQLVAAI
jgi:hypothetical protein